MRYFVDDVLYEVTDEEMEYRHIAEGTESNVYRFRDEVFKIYKDNRVLKSKLDEKSAKYMKNIKTKRIIMPKRLIYDRNDNFCGYTLPYLDNCQKSILKRKKMTDIINELKLIEDDLLLLKEKSIDLEDFTLDNFIVNKGLYIIDPGSHEVSTYDKRLLETINKHRYLEFMINKVFPLVVRLNSDEKKKLNDYIAGEYLTDVLDYDIKENDTLKKYIKRIVK